MCIVFMYIMEKPVSDIFSTFVFNNIMEVTFIFSPRVFLRTCEHESINRCNFNDIDFFEVPAINR
jgi:hypothetical protein